MDNKEAAERKASGGRGAAGGVAGLGRDVMDAERAALCLERGERAGEVIGNNLKVTLGTLAHGVYGLGERLAGRTVRLHGLTEALGDKKLRDLLNALLTSRNEWDHRHLAVPGCNAHQK